MRFQISIRWCVYYYYGVVVQNFRPDLLVPIKVDINCHDSGPITSAGVANENMDNT